MNHAAPQSTVPAPLTARDTLADLLHEIITSPNQGTRSQAQACATVALAFTHVAGSDDRLATQHRDRREQSLVKALARALQIVEMTDLDEAVRIVGELEGDVAPLVGGPIDLVCGGIEIVPLLPEPAGCIFGQACVHRAGGA